MINNEEAEISPTPDALNLPPPMPAIRRSLQLADWVQLMNAGLLLIAAVIAGWSVISSRHTARLMAADVTWERYMELAFQNPELEAGTFRYLDSNSPNDVRYAWFVERGLFAGDQIMSIEPQDPQWQDSIAGEIAQHRNYILSNTFLLESPERMSSFCTYRAVVRKIIIRTLHADPRARDRLNAAELRCEAALKQRGAPSL